MMEAGSCGHRGLERFKTIMKEILITKQWYCFLVRLV
jgi:hypothetical protein